eukprot:CAMPEP_0197860730 /NCGR_PEP_ID=MMETSP1438-20131217/36336_1 /TAXON_ID=1461541 /ORGANISM="Pterosperma sp., Strain CCMP1384" /LENGTH=80 /DNA_ID=CAMNT_0043477709 /DNA_START=113 /DNA_END=354 /DNA_ORIENTATION=+
MLPTAVREATPLKYKALENAIKAKFSSVKCSGQATPEASGKLEVVVDGKLVHSKAGGDGYVDSPDKLGKILDAIGAAGGK